MLEPLQSTPYHACWHGSPCSQLALFFHLGPLVELYSSSSAWPAGAQMRFICGASLKSSASERVGGVRCSAGTVLFDDAEEEEEDEERRARVSTRSSSGRSCNRTLLGVSR